MVELKRIKDCLVLPVITYATAVVNKVMGNMMMSKFSEREQLTNTRTSSSSFLPGSSRKEGVPGGTSREPGVPVTSSIKKSIQQISLKRSKHSSLTDAIIRTFHQESTTFHLESIRIVDFKIVDFRIVLKENALYVRKKNFDSLNIQKMNAKLSSKSSKIAFSIK